MLLLLGDRRRVWWRDLEGVFAGEEAYVSTLTEWAGRSRAGRLRLGRSSSAGTAKRGRRTSSSWLTAGATASPTPNVRDDFLNIAIISEINRLIGRTGYHFAVCDNLGMPSWVVALKREEEKRLRGERGWSFLAL
jgi:hypothetical protein